MHLKLDAVSVSYYILKCRIHKGEIYSLTKDDDICGGCAKKMEFAKYH